MDLFSKMCFLQGRGREGKEGKMRKQRAVWRERRKKREEERKIYSQTDAKSGVAPP